MRPASVFIKGPQFDWLIEALCLHQPAWPLLRWVAAYSEAEGEGLRLSPPEGDFAPILEALTSMENEIAAFNELVRVYNEIMAIDAEQAPLHIEAVTAAMEATLTGVMERADRLDILRNFVFFQVGPDFPHP